VTYALPIAALVLTILIGQSIFGTLAFMLGGESLRSAVRCGFSMAQIGEFSFIIASLGLSLGVISDFLYPVVVAVSVITTFLTPYMIRLSVPASGALERRLPNRLIHALNYFSTNRANTNKQSLWKRLLVQMTMNTVVYSILTIAVIFIMFTFVHPFFCKLLPGGGEQWYPNALTGVLTVLFISPFLRAMIMKKNHSEEFKALWAETGRNQIPLLLTILIRVLIAITFVFYICHHLSHFARAIIITAGVIIVGLIVASRGIKRSSIRLERMFINNLRSRDIAAQVRGSKRPLYEGRLLDRDVHMVDFDIPMNSRWMGHTLRQLELGSKFGVHISSILRANHRLNIPDGDYLIFPGDKIQVIGSDQQLAAFGQAVQKEVFGEDLNFEQREMKLHQIVISATSPFVNKTLEQSGIRSIYSCMVVGLEEGEENLSPVKPSRKFRAGDIIWVVGEQDAIDCLINA